MMPAKGPVVVTGAAGFIGSWLVKRLLEDGYAVRATVRDPSNVEKVKPLLDLPDSGERLTLWKADLTVQGSFDKVVAGCTGVFHVATPVAFATDDPELIKATVDGEVSLLESCKSASTVERVVLTSTSGTVLVSATQELERDESFWTDVDFCRRVKMLGWGYCVAKTLGEKAAWDFASDKGVRLITVIPPIVVGDFICSTTPLSIRMALAPITGDKQYYPVLRHVDLVHVDDLCNAHIFLFEHPEANGRYICSSHETTIFELGDMLRSRYPDFDVPIKFEGIDKEVKGPAALSSRKLKELGFQFQHTVAEMFDEAINACREKKLIAFKEHEIGEAKRE